MTIIKNIKLILTESYRWRNRKLLEPAGFTEPQLDKENFLKKNLVLVMIGIPISLVSFRFINDAFAGYVISALSIFVGLFTSVLILVFDKYLNQKKAFQEIAHPSSAENVEQKKLTNFSRQFVFVTLESLLIALTLISLLLIPLLFKERYLENIFDYHFVNFKNVEWLSIKYLVTIYHSTPTTR